MSNKKSKKNIAERLFYTFGSIFLAAIIAVCIINFTKDGRAAQAAFLPATSVTSADHNSVSTAKASGNSATTKNSTAKTSGKSPSKTPAEQSPKPSSAAVSSTASSNSSGSNSTAVQKTVTAEP